MQDQWSQDKDEGSLFPLVNYPLGVLLKSAREAKEKAGTERLAKTPDQSNNQGKPC